MTTSRETTTEETGTAPAPLAAAGAPATRESTLLALQRSAGNQAVLRLLRRSAGVRMMQRRRVPGVTDLMDLISDPTAPDAAAHQAGAERLIKRAWDSLSAAERARVQARARGTGTWTQFRALTAREKSIRWAHAIRQERPAIRLGDPLLIDTGPRPGTADAANVQKLVDNANAVFATIASGSRNADIRQVFGAANLSTAKRKYANARLWMNRLHGRGQILADRSGYNEEVILGGLTGFQSQLSVVAEAIDNPDEDESVATMIHEAMHAGNDDVGDLGYIGTTDADEFKAYPARDKLRNAAHFEVVPRRILDAAEGQFAGETFVPAGSSASSPSRTPRQQAIRGATEMFDDAWSLGLNLHKLFVGLVRNLTEWDTLDLSRRFGGVRRGLHFSDTLPFWSKVMRLTIHERTSIDPLAGQPETNPVTMIDVALSEGMIRKLALAGERVPADEAAATTFLTDKATAAERAAATTVTAERDLLIRLVLKERVGSITGSTDRDVRAVLRMGTVGGRWRDILAPRSPADFAG